MVEDFSSFFFRNSETFTVKSSLEAISGLPVVKEVIVFILHIVDTSFQCFAPLQ